MRNCTPHLIRAAFFLFLTVFSFLMIYATHQNMQTARLLAWASLESTALALSTAAENVLRESQTRPEAEIRDLLSDRVIAYALISGPDGTILFHTNSRLVGTKLPEDDVFRQLAGKNVSSKRITLGTGIPAYEFNYTLHQPDGRTELLRLILHTAEADAIAARAERMWWLVGISLLLLWIGGLALERLATRYLHLQALSEEQKRLALVGQMAASLAHEVRNAISSVKGFAQWIDEKTADAKPLKAATTAILQGTGRIESLVNELLIFSRQENYNIEDIELKELVAEAVAGSLSGWRGKTEADIETGRFVKADRQKLYRAMVNGMKNAVEAMAGEGTLRIISSAEGRWVTLRIEDTGPGVSPEGIRLLFTPFYTTKPEGTGLGLAYARKVVEGMKGRIALENRKEARGAVLSITLPAS